MQYYGKKSGNHKEAICPSYKIVSGTTFGVDSFRFGVIEGITHYFLTHFHADHYVGLTKNFKMPIYLSPITYKLVEKIIKIDSKYLNSVPMNQPFMVNDVEITAVDANQ